MNSKGNSTNVENEDKMKNIELNQVQKKEDSSNISKTITQKNMSQLNIRSTPTLSSWSNQCC